MLEGRSSIGRLGLFVHVTAGFGDVGFKGFWTLEIFCIQPVKIYPSVEICQVYYHTIEGEIKNYSSQKYQNNRGIQSSLLFKDFKNGEYKLIKQTGGKGQYGHVKLKVEPNSRGKGFTYNNHVVGGEIPKEFFNACETGVREALTNGVILGYPVVDVHVDLVSGSSHDVDSNEQAFKIAAILAVRDAFQQASSVLLEPVMLANVDVPDEYQGDIIGDLNRRRGRIVEIDSRNGLSAVRAEVPLAEMFGYATDMRSLSKGRASFSMEPLQFEEVPAPMVERMMEQYV